MAEDYLTHFVNLDENDDLEDVSLDDEDLEDDDKDETEDDDLGIDPMEEDN